jgi:hypothetical protein
MAEIVDLAAVRNARLLLQNGDCNKQPEPDYRQQFLDLFVLVGSLPMKKSRRKPSRKE